MIPFNTGRKPQSDRRFQPLSGRHPRRIREVDLPAQQDSDATLTEIALETGFADQSHMGRYFQRYLGQTPASLRRRPDFPCSRNLILDGNGGVISQG